MKPSPKKETARIQIPAQPKDLPKATIKMQATQRLQPAPTSAIKPVPVQVATTSEGLAMPLSIGALIFSFIAFAVQLWIYLS